MLAKNKFWKFTFIVADKKIDAKRTNLGINTTDARKKTYKPKHRHSKRSRLSKLTVTPTRFAVSLNLLVFPQ